MIFGRFSREYWGGKMVHQFEISEMSKFTVTCCNLRMGYWNSAVESVPRDRLVNNFTKQCSKATQSELNLETFQPKTLGWYVEILWSRKTKIWSSFWCFQFESFKFWNADSSLAADNRTIAIGRLQAVKDGKLPEVNWKFGKQLFAELPAIWFRAELH